MTTRALLAGRARPGRDGRGPWPGAGRQGRSHAAPPRPREPPASWPHRSRTRPDTVRENAPSFHASRERGRKAAEGSTAMQCICRTLARGRSHTVVPHRGPTAATAARCPPGSGSARGARGAGPRPGHPHPFPRRSPTPTPRPSTPRCRPRPGPGWAMRRTPSREDFSPHTLSPSG